MHKINAILVAVDGSVPARPRPHHPFATAFRRLKHKTQVFVAHEGDHYRTRLTHSLEVAQIARIIARVAGLDEDLAEARGAGHDLGHRRSAMPARRRWTSA
jgi:HD superfamily phosphodiesterase